MITGNVGRPWSIQVELAEGCNRLCSFCGLNGIRERPGNYKFMTKDTATKAARELAELCPEARYEFAMHGEPLVNPDHLIIFRIFRSYLPKAQMQVTTNGKRLLSKGMQRHTEEIFKAGIDFIVLDTYQPERDRLWEEAGKLTGMKVVDFYKEAKKGFTVYANKHRKLTRTVVLMDDLGARDGETKSRTIVNHAGNNPLLPTPEEPLKKTCTIPFRELSICYDGNVNLCCIDWGHEYVVGNINEQNAAEIWWSPKFEAARAFLQNKNREFSPCSRCDKNAGTRPGLLPKYPKITAEQKKIVKDVIASAKPRNGKKAEVLF